MSRAIRFRAWDSKNNEMLHSIQCGTRRRHSDANIWCFSELILESEVEILQSTGLKDKNDTEIYEGDIVKIQDNATYYYGVVVYSDKYASFVFRNTNSIKFEDENIGDYDGLEIIGNIYENPNLLQEEQ